MPEPAGRPSVALIGEPMLELTGTAFGAMHQSYAGDTLNTAIYLARLAREFVDVRYVTALGTGALCSELIRRWQLEGVDTQWVLRDPGRHVGMYLVQTDASGERRFTYWRGESAARFWVQHPDFNTVVSQFSQCRLLYLSGISLAILPEADRSRLLHNLKALAQGGCSLVFDTNYRPTLWSQREVAQECIRQLYAVLDLQLTTYEDEQHLWGDATPEDTVARLHAAGVRNVVVKMGPAGALCSNGDSRVHVPAQRVNKVVDTTAAGDSFNAAFLAAWLQGADLTSACQAGNALAAVVIGHPGGIIPAAAMPAAFPAAMPASRIRPGT